MQLPPRPPQHPYTRRKNADRTSVDLSRRGRADEDSLLQHAADSDGLAGPGAPGQDSHGHDYARTNSVLEGVQGYSTSIASRSAAVSTPPTHPSISSARPAISEPSIANGLRASLASTAVAQADIPIPELAIYSAPSSERSHSPSQSRAPSPTPSSRSRSPSHSMRSFRLGSPSPTPEDRAKRHSLPRRPFSLYSVNEDRQDVAAALEELKDLELSEFIERASKSMDEVHFEDTSRPVSIPTLDQYRNPRTHQADYLAFAEAWLCAMADTHFPRDIISGTKPSKLSLSKSRHAVERIYVLLPPELLQHLLEGKLAALYRWEDPFKTGRYALSYLALWWYDQLPAGLFAYIAYRVVKPRIWLPSPEKVRRELALRKARSSEAKEIGSEFERQARFSHLSNSVASSIGVAAVMGGLVMPGPLGMHRTTSSNPASSDESSEDDDAVHLTKDIQKTKKKKFGKRRMYRLTRELLDRFGPVIQLLLTDAADFCEKAKNLFLWRRPAASQQSLLLISPWVLLLSVLPGYLQLKLLLLWAWFQFFVIWALQDRYPRYRRALNPIWYFLWNIPSDADSALEILKERANRPHEVDAALPRVSTDRLSVDVAKHGRSLSNLSDHSQSSLYSEGSAQSVMSRHFAICKGIPGHLIFTPTDLAFDTVRGFRTLSSKIFHRRRSGSGSGPESENPARLFREELAAITAVKKESRFDIGVLDTDGLLITFADKSAIRLASVARRDEAFAFILARSGQRAG